MPYVFTFDVNEDHLSYKRIRLIDFLRGCLGFLGQLESERDLEQYIEYHPDTKKHKCVLCKFLTNRPAKVLRQPAPFKW